MLVRYIILFLATIFFNSFLVAQENENAKAKKSVRHIVSFSISNFDKLQFEPAPTKSTNQIIEKLKAENKFTQFSEVQIYGAADKIDSSSFFSQLEKIETKIKDDDELIIYISSHGVEVIGSAIRDSESKIKDKSQLLFVVTNENKQNWIPMFEVVKILSKPKFIKAKKLLILDTCRAYDSEESNSLIIGAKWKNHANTTEGFIEGEPELKKFLNGDRTANLNLAIMYACSSGMKSYFLPKEQYAFFSESLRMALSYEAIPYSLQKIFEKTRRYTIHDAKVNRNERQEPFMVVYQNTIPGSKTFVNDWFFGIPQTAEEAKELELVHSGVLATEIDKGLKEKFASGKLTNLDKLEGIQKRILNIKGQMNQVLDITLLMNKPEPKENVETPVHFYDINKLVEIINERFNLPQSDEDLFSYSSIAFYLVKSLEKIKKGIKPADEKKIALLSTSFNNIQETLTFKFNLVKELVEEIVKLSIILKTIDVPEFDKETNWLKSLYQGN